MQMNSFICLPFLLFISRMSSCIHISSITLACLIHCFMISHVLTCCVLCCFQLKILIFLFPYLPAPIKCCAIIVMLLLYMRNTHLSKFQSIIGVLLFSTNTYHAIHSILVC